MCFHSTFFFFYPFNYRFFLSNSLVGEAWYYNPASSLTCLWAAILCAVSFHSWTLCNVNAPMVLRMTHSICFTSSMTCCTSLCKTKYKKLILIITSHRFDFCHLNLQKKIQSLSQSQPADAVNKWLIFIWQCWSCILRRNGYLLHDSLGIGPRWSYIKRLKNAYPLNKPHLPTPHSNSKCTHTHTQINHETGAYVSQLGLLAAGQTNHLEFGADDVLQLAGLLLCLTR
jgi:hypothetical protein